MLMIDFLFIIFLLLIIITYFYFKKQEEKEWNNGKAPCGTPWRYFDTDSQGGRGYMCSGWYWGSCKEKHGHTIWCSYDSDKHYNKEKEN